MSYDPGREDEKLENRVIREMDRRFTALEKVISEIESDVKQLKEEVDKNFKEIAKNKRENYIWLLRLILTSIVSILASGGAFYFVQIITRVKP